MKRLILPALLLLTTIIAPPASANETINEDAINLVELPYGLLGWPANKLLVIKSPLIEAPIGIIYITKSGYKDTNLVSAAGELLLSPFTIIGSIFGGGSKQPAVESDRGRVISNLWVSRQGSCSIHSILQKRFYGDGDDSLASNDLNIKRIDIGAGGEIVSLHADSPPAIFRRSEFTFTRCSSGQYSNCPEYTGQEYVLRRDWPLSSAVVRSLALMPSGRFKIRYVFDSHTQIAEIPDGAAISKIFSSCS